MKFVDLSVPLNENTPVFPGDSPVAVDAGGMLEKDGYEDHYVRFGTHIGTHVDAPSHMVAGGKNLDQIPLEQFSGRGVLVKVGKKFDVSLVQNREIKAGDVVIFATGMDKEYGKPEYFSENPEMNEELANYLVKQKVKMVGVDSCSVDRDPWPIHRILLGNNILLLENLTNFEALDGKKFNIHAFPVKLTLDGAPVRVVAEII